jgi:hypothetical protein
MPDPQIANPAGAYGNTASSGTPDVVEMVNTSGTTRTYGDVVIVDATGTLANTTTTVNDRRVLGVVAQGSTGQVGATQGDGKTYAAGATMPVVVRGIARINIGTTTVAASDVLTTAGTAGVAATNAAAPSANAVIGSCVGIALEANSTTDTNSTIRAYIMKA